MKIGIIGAMRVEVESLASLLENRRETRVGGIDFWEGTLSGREVALAVCGVGKVFAAMCAQTMIACLGVTVIVNTGVAGALDSRLSICDAVVADAVCQHDMDTSAIGDPVGLISGINIVDIPCDIGVIEALEKSLGDTRFIRAKIASGDVFVGDDEKKNYIRDTFGAAACEMEGAAIGQVCYVNKIPFGVLRTISDSADGTDYMTFVGIAAEKGKEAILKFIDIYK